MAVNESDVALLLDQVTQWNQVMVQAKSKYQAELAPDFSLIDWLKNDELALSRYLRFLLSPEETHGQSDLFLKEFISLINRDSHHCPVNCGSDVKVDYEVTLPSGRRVDLLMMSSQSVIGLENKPWAADQENQLLDYAQWLAKKEKPWKLVYLCNNEPSEYTLPAKTAEDIKSNVITLSWWDIAEWLTQCALHIRAGNVRLFVESFVKYINQSINYDVIMDDDIELSKIIKRDVTSIEAAFMVCNKIEDVKFELFNKFIEDLQSKCEKIKIETSDKKPGNKYFGFYIPFGNEGKYSLCWEFDQKNYNNLYFGLYGVDVDENKNLQLRNIMSNLFTHMNGNANKIFTWWSWDLDPQGRNRVPTNWGNEGTVWSQLNRRDEESIFAAISETISIFMDNFDINDLK